MDCQEEHETDDKAFAPPLRHLATLEGDGPQAVLRLQSLADTFAWLKPHVFSKLSAVDDDWTVYAGSTGAVYLLLVTGTFTDTAVQTARQLCRTALDCHSRRVSFLNGHAGVLALRCVLEHVAGKPRSMHRALRRLLRVNLDNVLQDSVCEVMYGVAGYLAALLVVAVNALSSFEESFRTALIDRIYETTHCLVEQGRSHESGGLDYHWHRKHYIGGAHGVAGIVYTLVKARDTLQSRWNSAWDALLVATVDQVLKCRLESGNYPSRPDSASDTHVQWCHGAPAVIQMLICCSSAFPEHAFRSGWLDAARDAAEVVWDRGFLQKGPGLCHGVGGNGLVLLQMYKATHEPMYLRQAQSFAIAMIGGATAPKELPDFWGRPDEPWCLMNGAAGATVFLHELLHHPSCPRFPGLDPEILQDI